MTETTFFLSLAVLLTFFGIVIAVSSGINELMERRKERRTERAVKGKEGRADAERVRKRAS